MTKKSIFSIAAGCAVAIVAAVAFVVLGLRPSGVPDKKTMAAALADMYAVDALMQECQLVGDRDASVTRIYGTVLRKYGLTKLSYDSALAVYSRDPEAMAEVYERAVSILSQREANADMIAIYKDSVDRELTRINDSLCTHIGKLPTYVTLPLDTKTKEDTLRKYLTPKGKNYTKFAIDFDLDSIVGGYIAFKEKYTVQRVEDTRKAQEAARRNAKSSVKTLPSNPKIRRIQTTSDAAKEAAQKLKQRCSISLAVTFADSSVIGDTLWIESARRLGQNDAELKVQLHDSIPAVKVTITPFQSEMLHDIGLAIRDLRLYHKPYDVNDTTDYDSRMPLMFAL